MSLNPAQFFHGTSRSFDGPVLPQPGDNNTIYRVGGKDYFPPEMTDDDWATIPTDLADHIKAESVEGREVFAADNEPDAWHHAHKSGLRGNLREGRDEGHYMAHPAQGQRVLSVTPRANDLRPDGAHPDHWVASKAGFDVQGEVTIPPPGEVGVSAVQGRLWGDDFGRRWSTEDTPPDGGEHPHGLAVTPEHRNTATEQFNAGRASMTREESNAELRSLLSSRPSRAHQMRLT